MRVRKCMLNQKRRSKILESILQDCADQRQLEGEHDFRRPRDIDELCLAWPDKHCCVNISTNRLTTILSWMQSATSSSPSSKSKVPQVNPMTRPAHDPKKQGACAKSSGDLITCDQTRNKSPDTSHVLTCDKSRDSICFGQARSPLINRWQTVGTVYNQQRHMTLVIG